MSCNLIDNYLSISNEYGEIISKKAYGDFSNQTLAPWKKAEKVYGMDLVQISSSGKGKSTTDIKLIIDLISDFYHNNDNVFVLVSNDNDFIEVAKKTKMYESKLIVDILNKKIDILNILALIKFRIRNIPKENQLYPYTVKK